MTDHDPPTGAMPPDQPATQVLNDRYELHRLIGRGGMAEVFLARDRSLDRPVAVKVLFPEFATDPSFVERFRREAQSAANLTHPNIVGVYDWGTQGSTYYIVMEYVQGRTLSEIIRGEGPLHPTRAAEIANEVASALGFAAQRGVVHRDIKPGNVIISSSGTAKVADFGIARALASNDDELTKTGAVMGTATYFSPEQAQGLRVDPRSDLYSLGVVLYEMLVGRPPFQGDSPVAIAYKHVQESPNPPSKVASGIPAPLDGITMRLLAKNPDNRYLSADDLRADLGRFMAGQPVHAEEVMVTPVPIPDQSATAMNPALTGATAAVDDAIGDGTLEAPKRSGVFIVMLVVLLAALGGLIFWLSQSLGEDDAEMVEVPQVEGMPEAEARTLLEEAGFQVDVQQEESADVEQGLVISQDPTGEAPVDSVVTLVVSSGAGVVEVPRVVGLTQAEAESQLRAKGFVVTPRVVESEEDEGIVVAQTPEAFIDAESGSVVFIDVSGGLSTVRVPSVVGSTESNADSALRGAQLSPVVAFEETDENDQVGRVTSQSPVAGTEVAPGAQVTIVIGTEPAPPETTTTSSSTTTTSSSTTTTSTTTEPPPDDGGA